MNRIQNSENKAGLSVNEVKFIRSLHDRKGREEQGCFIAEGAKIVTELLKSHFTVRHIFRTDSFNLPGQLHHAVAVTEINAGDLKKISALTTPNQVLAVAEIPAWKIKMREMGEDLSLVLEDVRDPGNLGTIIRIADWFGIRRVICSETCVDVFNPKVVQASAGSAMRVKVYTENLESFLKELRETFPPSVLPVYAAVLGGENLYRKKPAVPGIILLGNESRGISPGVLGFATEKISIPSAGGGAESLNVAIAAALICSEFRREDQRKG